jgi:enoyl-CoA hydratase/carnithine racemase
MIRAADALHAGLADIYLPSEQLPALLDFLKTNDAANLRAAIRTFAAPFQNQVDADASALARERMAIDRHFAHDDVKAIVASLTQDNSAFAQKALAVMKTRSPIMRCVTLSQLRRGASMNVADCLRMERTMVRRNFEHGEILEGVRALVVDKDNAPKWSPATLEEVTPEMVERFFEPAWPDYAHPLRELK